MKYVEAVLMFPFIAVGFVYEFIRTGINAGRCIYKDFT